MKDAVIETSKFCSVKLKKGVILQLDNAISKLKIGKMSKDGVFALLDTKVELSGYIEKINEAQKIASEELKPKEMLGEENNQYLQKEWNNKFIEYMNIFLDEEIVVKLRKFSRDDLFSLIKENNLEMDRVEVINMLVY